MTFQEWQAGRSAKRVLSHDEAGEYAGYYGYVYEAGFMTAATTMIGDVYVVPLPQEEREFTSLNEAEAFLWAEWCDGELNG